MPTPVARFLAVLALAALFFPVKLRAQSGATVAIGTSRITVRMIMPDGGTVDAATAQAVAASGAQINSQLAGAGVQGGIETGSITYGTTYVQYTMFFLGITQEAHTASVSSINAAGAGLFSVVTSSWTQTGTAPATGTGSTGGTPGGGTGGTTGGTTGGSTGGTTGGTTGGSTGGNTGGSTGTGASAAPVLSGNPEKAAAIDQTARSGSKVAGPVDTGTGAESFNKRLFSLAGARPLDFVLSYSSAASTRSGSFGYGWYDSFSATLSENTLDRSVTISWSSARRNRYVLGTDGVYRSTDPAAKLDRVVKTTSTEFVVTRPDQSSFTFRFGSLALVTDRNGRSLVISRIIGPPVQITEPISGARLSYTYGTGGVTRLEDHTGRAYTFAYDNSGQLIAITDPAGRTTRYAYTGGRLSRVTASDGTVTYANVYDAYGRVISQEDARTDNKPTLFSYDETSQPGKVITTVTKRDGATRVYTHDSSLQLISLRDERGNAAAYEYDASGLLARTTDALGRSTTFTYDAFGNLTKIRDADGRETTHTYDSRQNRTSTRNPDGRTATFTYDSRNNLIQFVDFDGARSLFEYDANSLLTREVSPKGNTRTYSYTAGRRTSARDAVGNVSTTTYDAAGRVARITDATGGARGYTYTTSDLVATASDPLGNFVTYSYDARDRLVRFTDELGGAIQFTYDGNGNVLTRTDPLGGVTTYTYDGEDRRVSVTDARGNKSTQEYDAAGNQVAAVDEEGGRIRFSYDAAGNRTGVFDALGSKVLTTTYTASDLPATTEDALGRVRSFDYDPLLRLRQATDPLARVETFGYDAAGRPSAVTSFDGLRTSFSYDADGNVSRITDSANAVTQFSVNANGRRTEQITPGGRRATWTYDNRDLLATYTNFGGSTTALTYNGAGQLTRQNDPAGLVSYAYDRKGRPVSTSDGTRTVQRGYDALDRVTRFTDGDGNVLLYAYDANGNLTSLTYPDGKRVSYTYDKANRVTRIVDWANRETRYTYDANGRIIGSTRANGTKLEQLFDAAGQLIESVTRDPRGTVILDQRFTYDDAGRLASEAVTPAPVLPPVVPATLTYDSDNRIRTFGNSPVTYDAAGNLSAGPLGDGTTTTFQYDVRGRLTSVGNIFLRYDPENRRVATDIGSTRTTYVINPQGRPYSQLLQERTGAQTILYVWGPEGMLYRDIAGQLLHYHHDFRGSTVAVTGADGAVSSRWSYGPYGEVQRTMGTDSISHLFGGQHGVMQETNGLYYMRSRHYSPVVRRFLTPDPMGFKGGQNWYAYAEGVPTYRIDPNGELSQFLVGAVAGIVVGVAGQVLGDIAQGKVSSGAEYAGAIVGGAVGGVVTAWSGNIVEGQALGAATGAFVGNLIKQGFSKDPYKGSELLLETTLGAVLGPVAKLAPEVKNPLAAGGTSVVARVSASEIGQEVVKGTTDALLAGGVAPWKGQAVDSLREPTK